MTQDKKDIKSRIRFDKKLEEKIRERKEPPPTKVVIRRLPPSLTSEAFLEQVSPLPDHDFYTFVKADKSLGKDAFTRVYVNFLQHEDIYTFREKFDEYVFVDAKGGEYPAIVELSPFQRVPKKKDKKPDSKKGTLSEDPEYEKFLESLANPESDHSNSLDTYLEQLETKERLKGNHGCPRVTTPLIDYIRQRKEEKRAAIQRGKDERRKKELEKRKLREDERRRKREKEEKLKGKERDKDTVEKKKDDSQVKQLLKNPERDREKPRDSPRGKLTSEGEKPREHLRFSKENREKAAKEKEEEKARFGRNSKPVTNVEKQKSDWEEKSKGKDDKKLKDEKVDGTTDSGKEKSKFYEKDKESKSKEKAGVKSKDYDGEGDRKRDIKRDKERLETKNKVGDKSRGFSKEENIKDKDRDDRSRPCSSKSFTETSSVKEEKKGANCDDDSSRRRMERERNKTENKTAVHHGDKVEKADSDKNSGNNQSKSKLENLASQSDSSLQSDSQDQLEQSKDKDGEESPVGRRRRKDRPERAIYVPRRARESRTVGDPKDIKSGSGDQPTKT